ncbi:MAG TPA: hypothetical protein VKB14_05020 [Actinomycetales bacterium]|nr:hypothetical protein [Actinomycetales bacterium]
MTRTTSALRAQARPVLTLVPPPASGPYGEVCVLLDPGRAVVWLHGVIDESLADDLADAATDLLQAGLPVRIEARSVSSADAVALRLVTQLLEAGLPVEIHDPSGRLTPR